ncbi:MAG: PAS domain S-box protein, partial [Planctomycetota bacterium]|nr:PAS domain S-box protein [Planctomycetota bacterium]
MNLPEKQSQDSFRLLVETASCMIVILREDHSIAYFNSFAERLTGYSAEEVLGQDYIAFFLPDVEKAGVDAEIERVFAGGPATQEYENAVRCRDGSLRWLEWNAQRLDDFEGHPGLLAVGHDITDRKRATEDLRHQEARLRAVLDTAVDGIITINERGIVQSVNSAAERIFDYTSEEMIGHNISMLMPSPYREEHDGYLANYLRTGEKKIIGIGREVEARRKDGTTFPCDLAVSEVPLPDQRLFTGIVRDVTERKKAQDALVERETFLQTIFDTEPECVKLLGPGGILLRMNRAGLKMIEAESFQQVEGKCVYPIIVPEYRQAFESLTDKVFDGKTGTLEFEIVGLKGTRRRLDTHAVPLRNPQGEITALLGITRDITEQKRAEERALQAERLAAIGETIAGLAHESRNAFQRSQACLEMLALELENRPDQLELVDRTQRALDHLHRLYEEVRDYAAPINLDRQSCDLA